MAMGGEALAATLTVPDHTLRVFLHWNATGEPLAEPVAAALTTATGAADCPGLTCEAAGTVVAVSLPDPPRSTRTAEPQTGRKPGSPGRLLPGLLTEAIPPGWTLDESGYLVR